MLENQPIKHVANDLDRRWMSDDYFDLIVWYEPSGAIHGFQLCYERNRNERALTWTRQKGFRHSGIDSGEQCPLGNATPVLRKGAAFPAAKVQREFAARSKSLPAEIRELVLARIAEYAQVTASKHGT